MTFTELHLVDILRIFCVHYSPYQAQWQWPLLSTLEVFRLKILWRPWEHPRWLLEIWLTGLWASSAPVQPRLAPSQWWPWGKAPRCHGTGPWPGLVLSVEALVLVLPELQLQLVPSCSCMPGHRSCWAATTCWPTFQPGSPGSHPMPWARATFTAKTPLWIQPKTQKWKAKILF